jgi:hypothetical protein
MADGLRADIERAQARMSSTLGSRREIKRLTEHLWDGEQVEVMVSGQYGGGSGLLVLTDRRLVFVKDGVMKKTLEDFPLDKVSSVQWSSGVMMGKISIFASGNKAEVSQVMKDDGKALTDTVRERISRPAAPSHASAPPPPSPAPPSPPPQTSALVADELRKLAGLRDDGVLTEEEFTKQKARLLGT